MKPLDVMLDAHVVSFASQFRETARDLFVEPMTGKPIHPGEFGTYREILVRKLLSLVVPEFFGIGTGFVVGRNGKISRQCDVIIYDRFKTPLFCSLQNQRFIPIETVIAVIEVKSELRSENLKDAVSHLIELKRLREELLALTIARETDGRRLLIDQIGTFILCDSFGAKSETLRETFESCRRSEEPAFSPNLLVSVQDGGFCYLDHKSMWWPFPVDAKDDGWIKQDILPLRPICSGGDKFQHIKLLLRYVNLMCEKVKTLHPELTAYFSFEALKG